MKNFVKIILGILLTTIFACSNNQFSEKEVEIKASKIVNEFDANTIEIFKKWGFGLRGEAEFWVKNSNENYGYFCVYLKKNDTVKISVGLNDSFKKDFPYSVSIDTSRYHKVDFYKINPNTINVVAIDNNGRDIVLMKNVNLKKIFKKNDPFKHFESLSTLKNKYGIIGTFYRPDIGNFIQFFLSPEYSLTYFPDKTKLNTKFEKVWQKEFSKGKSIKPNWNLRKLDKQIDNG